jgi:hypothetical protein
MLMTAQMDLANLAINATPHFPFAEDEHPFAKDHNDTPITPVCTHQPVLQANARQPLPPSYGYHFPATPHGLVLRLSFLRHPDHGLLCSVQAIRRSRGRLSTRMVSICICYVCDHGHIFHSF